MEWHIHETLPKRELVSKAVSKGLSVEDPGSGSFYVHQRSYIHITSFIAQYKVTFSDLIIEKPSASSQ